ncbi:MAG: hypothetical protein CBB97_23565 [Candidatus Endolissoclinum sp. TMED37]|nr:MAG: hypothetical protein CBB97_23565 [Candidatus Endolissoclinum sp. TMED37]
MSRRLFTFSSSARSLRAKMPKAAIFAACLVLIANLLIYQQERAGNLYSNNPNVMIEKSIGSLTTAKGIWLIGNSTLAAGVSRELIRDYGNEATFVTLGSASFPVLTAVIEQALAKADAYPSRIVIFFTKDDLNQNGDRVLKSKGYLNALEGVIDSNTVWSKIPANRVRYAIRQRIIKLFYGPFSRPQVDLNERCDPNNECYKDFGSSLHSTYLANLGKDFKTAEVDLSLVGKLTKEKGIRTYLVAPPTANVVAEWQQLNNPEMTWPDIISLMNNEAAQHDIILRDYSTSLESTTEYFEDPYHLNDRGRQAFTELLVKDLFGRKR